MATWPPRLSTEAITRSTPIASASVRANAASTTPSRKSAEPAITACAPASSTARARSTDRMPPPTRQGSRPQICWTMAPVVALSFRRIEIDQLHPRKPGETGDPDLWVGRCDSEPLALDELHDAAALQVD